MFIDSDSADAVVYVVDRSGSMVSIMDYVRRGLEQSIRRLAPDQGFHIVFFSKAQTTGGPLSSLVAATVPNKMKAIPFIKSETGRASGFGRTLKSLELAFQVLRSQKSTGHEKVLHLVSDGGFAGVDGGSRYKGKSGDEAIILWLRDNNAKQSVIVNTYLYGRDPRALLTMRKIAEGNGGSCVAVEIE